MPMELAQGDIRSLFKYLHYFPGRVEVVDQRHFFVLSVSLFVSLKSLKLPFFVSDVNVFLLAFFMLARNDVIFSISLSVMNFLYCWIPCC